MNKLVDQLWYQFYDGLITPKTILQVLALNLVVIYNIRY